MSPFPIDETFLVETLSRLVQIDSRNPSLATDDPTAPGEAAVAAYLAGTLETLGLAATIYPLGPGRANVVGVLHGTGGGRTLLLNGHTDTVGVEGMAEPYAGAVRDGKLYGRGSQDMKGGLAAMLAAAKALRDAGTPLAGDLVLTFAADEEYFSAGSEHLATLCTADAAIVTEPTDLAVCCAHRGFLWYEVETFGRAAHGSRYQEGIDANLRMGRFLARLDKLEQDLRQRPPHPLAGPPSLHASLLRGGSEISTYAAHCSLKVERRTSPGETTVQATHELEEILEILGKEDATFKASLKLLAERPPFEIDPRAEIVRAVEAAYTRQLGTAPRRTGVSFWSDAALWAAAGIPTLLLGPTGHGLHSAEEWVDIQSVRHLAAILADTAASFVNGDNG